VLGLLRNPVARHITCILTDVVGKNTAGRLYDLFNFALPKVASFEDEYFKLNNSSKVADLKSQYLAMLSQIPGDELGRMNLNSGHDLIFQIDGLNILHAMMLIDFKMFLADDILVKVDRATMGVALEGREPLLDNKLVEYACALPKEYKYKNGISKSILRDILYRYVPREMVERPKQGFAIPVEDLLKGELSGIFNQYVNLDRIRKEGLFNPMVISEWLMDFKTGKSKINTKLWYLFVFEMWAERWLYN
jgi:asparagine synthase (glutamine-hydrolysing)